MKTMRAKVIAGTILSAFVTLAIAPAAYARTVGAWAGNPLTSSRSACYSESAGAVQSTIATGCSGEWEVNLPIDASGSFTVTFTAKNNAGAIGTVSCAAFAVAPNGTYTSTSNVAASTTSFATYSLSSISVTSGGNLYIACFGLGQGTVGTIGW